jgi:hypothetical protein
MQTPCFRLHNAVGIKLKRTVEAADFPAAITPLDVDDATLK